MVSNPWLNQTLRETRFGSPTATAGHTSPLIDPPHKISTTTKRTPNKTTMKQLDLDQPMPSQSIACKMPKDNNEDNDNSSTASENSYESPDSDEFAAPPSPPKAGRLGGSPRLTHRDLCDAGFGSWCDDSSTEDEDEDSAASFDSNDNIVVDFSSLSNTETFTSFYDSCLNTNEKGGEETEDFVSSDDDDKEDEIRISLQRCRDEKIFLDNLKRRKLRFSSKPLVKEFEPAPFSCHNDMYYSCHQLQKMMDAHYAGREFELEE